MKELRGKIRGADDRQAALLVAQRTLRIHIQESDEMLDELKRGAKEREEVWRKREEKWNERERVWREKEGVWGEEKLDRMWKEKEEELKGELKEALKLSECRRIEASLLTESAKSLQVQLGEVEKLVDIQGGLEREKKRLGVKRGEEGFKNDQDNHKNLKIDIVPPINNDSHNNTTNLKICEPPLDLKEMRLRLAALNEDGLQIQVFFLTSCSSL